MDLKIIVAGDGEYGLGKALRARWPHARYCSRKTGYDLCDSSVQARFAEESLEYEVFINCSSLWRFNQSLLAAKVWEVWTERGKSGQMVHLGSTADTGFRGGAWMYPIEKSAIQTLNRNFSYSAIGSGRIRSTLISPGYISTEKVEQKHPTKVKLEPSYIVKVIEWVLNQPEDININEISLDPIQRKSE